MKIKNADLLLLLLILRDCAVTNSVQYTHHYFTLLMQHFAIYYAYKNIKLYSIPMKPYIKGQYWMMTTIPLDDNYFLVVIIQSE